MEKKKRQPDYSQTPPETLKRMGRYVSPQSQKVKIHPIVKPFHFIENGMEYILGWLKEIAFLEILGIISNVGILLAVATYIGTEKQRRDTEVLNAWQTITSAHNQTGNGGRIQALEFLNASPADETYNYPGANWRRRSICLWLCLWPKEKLDGINLEVELLDTTASTNTSQGAYLARIQLPEASLAHAHLENTFLVEANLKMANLFYADLRESDLSKSNLEKAILWGASLDQANLFDANLVEANLGYASLVEANLRQVKLNGAGLANSNLHKADLRIANLEGSDLSSARLNEAFLYATNLKNANLLGANLQKSNLTLAKLDGANLLNANLQGVILREATLDKVLNLTQTQIDSAKLCRTILPKNINLEPDRDCKELGIDPKSGEYVGP